MTTSPLNLVLNNGAKMPVLSFGTWPPHDEEELETALDIALETGYRQFDTASAYKNESILGRCLRKWIDAGKIRRDELFIVTKLPVTKLRASDVEECLRKSLEDLQLDYVDLFLIHAPFGVKDPGGDRDIMSVLHLLQIDKTDLIATWRAMEAQVDAGRAKAIGVSNFNEKQIQRILDASRIKPANLQVEMHIYHQQPALVQFCQKNNISFTAYSPLGSRGSAQFLKDKLGANAHTWDLVNDETVVRLGQKHSKTAAQILLRFIIQCGVAAIPKSSNPDRIRSNFQVFDFELTADDMDALRKLDKGEKGRIFDFSFMLGITVHPEYPFKE